MQDSASILEELFQALGDRTRLRLLNLMVHGEVCVCFFVEVLKEPQPKISRHLAYLRRRGLVAPRKDAKWVHYRITPPANETARRIFQTTIAALSDDRAMQNDRLRLQRACCSPRVPEQLQRAPRPSVTGV
ncbi:MAG: metalloregulator ArsR/SmtB family transcription factor [Acidobacteriota bacterium]